MIKKLLLGSVAAASILAAGSANAATTTSPAGLTFTVGAACTLTGNVLNIGSFSVGDTVATYEARQGTYVSGATPATLGSAAAATLATVTCPTGTAWTLQIAGTATQNGVDVRDPSNAAVFTAYAYAQTVDGVAQARFINTGTSAAGTGTGAAQIVAGRYPTNSTTAAQKATVLVAGTYTGAATATLTY